MTIDYELVELGEGYQGEYDPTDPDDVELLRLDVTLDGEEIESLCTTMPVSLDPAQRRAFLQLVRTTVDAHGLSPSSTVELFSYAEPAWLEAGIPAGALERWVGAPTAGHFAGAGPDPIAECGHPTTALYAVPGGHLCELCQEAGA